MPGSAIEGRVLKLTTQLVEYEEAVAEHPRRADIHQPAGVGPAVAAVLLAEIGEDGADMPAGWIIPEQAVHYGRRHRNEPASRYRAVVAIAPRPAGGPPARAGATDAKTD